MKKLIPLLLCCMILCGCVFPAAPAETEPTMLQTEIMTDPVTAPETEALPTTVTIYYGNENADGFETAEVQVEEITMQNLVDQLITYGVLPENVEIQSLELDGTCLRLDFNTAFADHVCSMGSSGEMILFGSVVNTFLTAYPEAETVFITANGKIIESGHIIYDFEMTRYN